MRLLRSLAALVPLALFSACLDNTSPPQIRVEDVVFAPSLNVDLATSTKTQSGLYYKDLSLGTGTTFGAGTKASVYYLGYFSDGSPFDSVQPGDSGAPFTFTIGDGSIIPGFDEGVRGMKVGGRRQLIIPPWLAYGSYAYGGIPGNSVLVFVVDAADAQ